jgi:hypothetical protein
VYGFLMQCDQYLRSGFLLAGRCSDIETPPALSDSIRSQQAFLRTGNLESR